MFRKAGDALMCVAVYIALGLAMFVAWHWSPHRGLFRVRKGALPRGAAR